jgi:hypothetical protein
MSNPTHKVVLQLNDTSTMLAYIRLSMDDPAPRLGTRAARRALMRATIQARRGENRYTLEIEDISTTGARMKSSRALPDGTVVWLRLPGLEPIQAEVMWSHGFKFGCRFLQPLHASVFHNLLRQYAPRSTVFAPTQLSQGS